MPQTDFLTPGRCGRCPRQARRALPRADTATACATPRSRSPEVRQRLDACGPRRHGGTSTASAPTPSEGTADRLVRDALRAIPAHRGILITNLLVTDYSSMMVDFANTGRPMLFYTYDLKDGPHKLFDFVDIQAADRRTERRRRCRTSAAVDTADTNRCAAFRGTSKTRRRPGVGRLVDRVSWSA